MDQLVLLLLFIIVSYTSIHSYIIYKEQTRIKKSLFKLLELPNKKVDHMIALLILAPPILVVLYILYLWLRYVTVT